MNKLEFSTSEISASLEEIVSAGGQMTICVSGSSMSPFLIHGKDSVKLIKCRPQDLKKGEILLFRRSTGELVLHRVKQVLRDGSLIMNGDAQIWCEQISPEQAIAAVVSIERDGKITACTSHKYRTAVFLWQLMFPIRSLIFRVRNKLKRMRNKKD